MRYAEYSGTLPKRSGDAAQNRHLGWCCIVFTEAFLITLNRHLSGVIETSLACPEQMMI